MACVGSAPSLSKIWTTVLTALITNRRPTHRAWWGGSWLNCVLLYEPVPARCSSTLSSPLKPRVRFGEPGKMGVGGGSGGAVLLLITVMLASPVREIRPALPLTITV